MKHPVYRPDIDGLRAVAVLLVVGYHAFPTLLTGGFIGVDVFFVISGVLISTIIFQNLNNDSFSFVDFYCRRIRRIFPALLIVLIVALILGWWLFIPEDYEKLGKHTFGGAFFVSNLVSLSEFGYFDVAVEFKPLLHLWSLGIEEQFYLVWPVVVWLAWRFRVWLPAILVLGILGSFALDLYKSGFDTTFAFFSPKTRAWELLLGAGFAFISVYHLPNAIKLSQGASNALSVVGAALLAWGCVIIHGRLHYPGAWALLPAIGALSLIAAGPGAWINAKLLSNRGLIAIGLISYPLYLWHWVLLSIANVASATHPSAALRAALIVASFGLAALTFRWVEQPLRHATRLKAIASVLLVSLTVVGLTGLSIFKSQGLFGQTQKARLISAQAMASCAIEFNAGRLCVLGNTQASQSLLIYGDSQAEQLSVALNERLGSNYKLVFAFHAGCFTGDQYQAPQASTPECQTLIEKIRALRSESFDAVIRVQQWHGYGVRSTQSVTSAVNDAMKAFDLKTKSVILVGGVPSVDIRCAKWNYYFADTRWPKVCHDETASLDLVQSFQETTEQLPKIDHVYFVYPAQRLCNDGRCRVIEDGIQYYSDANHLTKDGANLVVSDIAAILDHAAP